MTENMLLAKHQQISKNIKIDYNNIRELFYEKVKDRADEIFLICPGENTVEFTLECFSEGRKYDSGSYSIEIINESILRWKSDDGRFEKVFNYTFIPEE